MVDHLTRRCHKALFIDYSLLREALAEFLGTSFLIILGDGSVAQKVLSRDTASSPLAVYLSWGLAVTMGIYIAGGVTGGHLNPSISLAMCLLGRLKCYKLPVYMLAQYAGAIFGAALVYAVYYDAINAFDGGHRQIEGPNGTAGIFSTYPQDYLTVGGGLGDQIVGTLILATCVMAITDKRNANVPQDAAPVLVGLVVVVIGCTYGYNCGYAINPARDLGPRLFTLAAGWGAGVFSYNHYRWFWIPIVGPHIGAILGALAYQLAVGIHWPNSLDHPSNGRTTSVSVKTVASSPRDTSDDIRTSLEHMDLNEQTHLAPNNHVAM